MSRKVVGLDIGRHSVKAVLVKESFRGIDLGGYFEKQVLEEGAEHLTSLIRGIFRENRLRPDIVVASLPGSQLSIHHLQLPFYDPRKLEQVLPYEIEPLIPFPVEEVIVDHFPLERMNGTAPSSGLYSICTGVVKKTTLQQHLNLLRGASVDARMIELDSLALFHAFSHFFKDSPQGPALLLDMGAAKTNACMVFNGKPQIMRTFGWGGQAITSAIQEALAVPMAEAEEKKQAYRGVVPGEGQEESQKISGAVDHVLEPLINGLFQTQRAFESQTGQRVAALYLTGGGSRLSGLAERLSQNLQCEVKMWKVPHPLVPGLGPHPKVQDLAIPGLGLALKGLRKDRSTGFNFRKDDLFVRKEFLAVRGKLVAVTSLALIASLLGGIDFTNRYQDRASQYQEAKKEIRKVYLETFPASKNIVDETQQMKTAVAELRKKVTALGGAVLEEVSPFDVLKEITEKIPPELHVEIQDFLVDRGRIRIQGVVDSFDAVERVKKELEGISTYRKVEITDAKLSADQKRVNFRISAEIGL